MPLIFGGHYVPPATPKGSAHTSIGPIISYPIKYVSTKCSKLVQGSGSSLLQGIYFSFVSISQQIISYSSGLKFSPSNINTVENMFWGLWKQKSDTTFCFICRCLFYIYCARFICLKCVSISSFSHYTLLRKTQEAKSTLVLKFCKLSKTLR